MTPTIGRIVHLKLSAQCAEEINRRRAGNGDTAAESAIRDAGGVIHKGNPVREGQEFPLLITRVWAEHEHGGKVAVNGQVFLDGNDVLWATSVVEGDEPGTWHWPERA